MFAPLRRVPGGRIVGVLFVKLPEQIDKPIDIAAGTAWRTMTYPFVSQCSQSASDKTCSGKVFRISLSWVETSL